MASSSGEGEGKVYRRTSDSIANADAVRLDLGLELAVELIEARFLVSCSLAVSDLLGVYLVPGRSQSTLVNLYRYEQASPFQTTTYSTIDPIQRRPCGSTAPSFSLHWQSVE